MEVKHSKKVVTSLFILTSILLSFFTVNACAQTMNLVVTGTNTFQIQVSNVYTWNVDENVNGTWVSNVLQGGSSGTPGTTFTRKGGTYTFRLRNCYPVTNGCSTSASKSVVLSGSAPAAPTIYASSGYTAITLSWTQPTGTSSFVFTKNGTQIGVSGTSYSDTAVVGGVTYSYSVKGCNTYGDCSAVASTSAALAVNPATQSKTTTYTYDELGRLTFMTDPVNGNRDYDYDKAGNRLSVATSTANDAATEPAVVYLPAPTGQSKSLIGNCAWRATWNLVAGAAKYLVRDTTGSSQYVTTTFADIGCPSNNSSANMPSSVQACDVNNICGTSAYF